MKDVYISFLIWNIRKCVEYISSSHMFQQNLTGSVFDHYNNRIIVRILLPYGPHGSLPLTAARG